jgi:hypothetical protein
VRRGWAGGEDAHEPTGLRDSWDWDVGAVELVTTDSTAVAVVVDIGEDIYDGGCAGVSEDNQEVGCCFRRCNFCRDGEGNMEGEVTGVRVAL